ncbi:hypothetical protein AALC17_09000 [Oscillospiraceae bacterium 38-13]
MRRLILIISICIALITLVGCGKQKEAVKDTVQTLADAFHDGDIKTINRFIFGANELAIDEELSDMWGNTSESQGGILEHVFVQVTLRVKNISADTVEFEVEAPDMSNVFTSLKADSDSITEDKLLQYIIDYAENAEKKTTMVSLKYIFIDEEAVVEYQDETFVNAVTGGLLDAYKSLYTEMIEEYAEGED